MQLYLDQSIMQPVGVKVTIRGGGELLLMIQKNRCNPHQSPMCTITCSSWNSELTPYSRNTRFYAALRVFAIFTFTLCSTWLVMTRNRSACSSLKILQGFPRMFSPRTPQH